MKDNLYSCTAVSVQGEECLIDFILCRSMILPPSFVSDEDGRTRTYAEILSELWFTLNSVNSGIYGMIGPLNYIYNWMIHLYPHLLYPFPAPFYSFVQHPLLYFTLSNTHHTHSTDLAWSPADTTEWGVAVSHTQSLNDPTQSLKPSGAISAFHLVIDPNPG